MATSDRSADRCAGSGGGRHPGYGRRCDDRPSGFRVVAAGYAAAAGCPNWACGARRSRPDRSTWCFAVTLDDRPLELDPSRVADTIVPARSESSGSGPRPTRRRRPVRICRRLRQRALGNRDGDSQGSGVSLSTAQAVPGNAAGDLEFIKRFRLESSRIATTPDEDAGNPHGLRL